MIKSKGRKPENALITCHELYGQYMSNKRLIILFHS
jgi:hypothetical protein